MALTVGGSLVRVAAHGAGFEGWVQLAVDEDDASRKARAWGRRVGVAVEQGRRPWAGTEDFRRCGPGRAADSPWKGIRG